MYNEEAIKNPILYLNYFKRQWTLSPIHFPGQVKTDSHLREEFSRLSLLSSCTIMEFGIMLFGKTAPYIKCWSPIQASIYFSLLVILLFYIVFVVLLYLPCLCLGFSKPCPRFYAHSLCVLNNEWCNNLYRLDEIMK